MNCKLKNHPFSFGHLNFGSLANHSIALFAAGSDDPDVKRGPKNVWPKIALALPCMLLLAQQSVAITVEEALAAAIDHSPELHQQYARYQSVTEQREIVQSEYYPQVSVRAAIGPEKTNFRSGQEVGERLTRDEVSLRISQLLFNGFATHANDKRLSHEAEAERLQLLASAENLALSVCEVYLNTREAQMLVTLADRHVKDHEAILDNIRQLAPNGFANETDVAQVSARLANARASLIAAQNDYQDRHAQFTRLVGAPPRDLTDPIADAALLPDSLETALSWARQFHPQLQSALADIQAAKEEVRASKSGYFPRLSVEGVANKDHDVGGIEGPDEDYRVMVVLEYDLFNGGRDVARSRASNWRYNESLEVRRGAEEDLLEGTRFSWNAYQSLQLQENLLRGSVDASTLAEEGYTTQFSLGRRSLLDLLNAKVEVFIARKTYLQTQYDLSQAMYRVLNSTGRLGYALRVNYPQEWQEEDAQ